MKVKFQLGRQYWKQEGLEKEKYRERQSWWTDNRFMRAAQAMVREIEE